MSTVLKSIFSSIAKVVGRLVNASPPALDFTVAQVAKGFAFFNVYVAMLLAWLLTTLVFTRRILKATFTIVAVTSFYAGVLFFNAFSILANYVDTPKTTHGAPLLVEVVVSPIAASFSDAVEFLCPTTPCAALNPRAPVFNFAAPVVPVLAPAPPAGRPTRPLDNKPQQAIKPQQAMMPQQNGKAQQYNKSQQNGKAQQQNKNNWTNRRGCQPQAHRPQQPVARPVRQVLAGWGNAQEQIHANDVALRKESMAKAAENAGKPRGVYYDNQTITSITSDGRKIKTKTQEQIE